MENAGYTNQQFFFAVRDSQEYSANSPQKTEPTKQCRSCLERRPESKFGNKGTKCNQCQYRRRHASELIKSAKARAAKQGIPFNLNDADIAEIHQKIRAGICERTGRRFAETGTPGNKQFSPSLDKIVPELGYVSGNIQVVCFWYNAAKGRMSDKEIIAMFREAVDFDQKCNS